MQALGGDAKKINPLCPVDLVIDHSIHVDEFGTKMALKDNTAIEMRRNKSAMTFTLKKKCLIPVEKQPYIGICHQVNLEYLAKAVWQKEVDGRTVAYPDTSRYRFTYHDD